MNPESSVNNNVATNCILVLIMRKFYGERQRTQQHTGIKSALELENNNKWGN